MTTTFFIKNLRRFLIELYRFWQYSIDNASKDSFKLSPSDSSDVSGALVS